MQTRVVCVCVCGSCVAAGVVFVVEFDLAVLCLHRPLSRTLEPCCSMCAACEKCDGDQNYDLDSQGVFLSGLRSHPGTTLRRFTGVLLDTPGSQQ